MTRIEQERLNVRRQWFPDATDEKWNDWRWQLGHRLTDVGELTGLLDLSPEDRTLLNERNAEIRAAATPYYLSLADPADRNDPILRQVVPDSREFEKAPGDRDDPLGEEADTPVKGVVHKYADRVLFITTDFCPVYCRHCTRRRKWRDGEGAVGPAEADAMLEYVAGRSEVRDVLISGGEPLTLPIPILKRLLDGLASIRHVEIVRIATRCPVVLPQRFDDELLQLFSEHLPLWLVTHFNHPKELTPESAAACRKILKSGVPIANQTVLLRGINDDAETMKDLCRGLLGMGVKPYYLFQCDPVRGTSHFRTSPFRGVEIIAAMRGRVSGLAIPTFAVDTEGGGKVPMAPDSVAEVSPRELILRNYEEKLFRYPMLEKEE